MSDSKIMEYTNSVQLLDLNDDCFLELFKYLPAADLCSIKQTNQRLWHLTNYYFQCDYSLKEKQVKLTEINGSKLAEVLQLCGHYIRDLIIESPHNYSDMNDFNENYNCHIENQPNTYISQLIATYCRENLRVLRLKSVFLSGFSTSNLDQALNNLQIIEMNKCCGDADQFMNHCPNVRVIDQRNCSFFLTPDRNYLLQNQHLNLESLIIYNDNQTDMVPEVLIGFFENKRSLKCFHNINRFAPTPTTMLPFIVRSVAHKLQELCIELETFSVTFSSDLRCLLNLQHLKRLEFNTDEIPVNTFINELATTNPKLECIGLSDVCLDEPFCRNLIEFTNLKVLKLISSLRYYDDFMALISKHLYNLEELYLVQCTEIEFGDVMAFIQNSQHLKLFYLYETPNFDWSTNDSFMQFTIDFVHLYKLRSELIGANAIDVCVDSKMMRLIEEHVWQHEFEWITKNGILNLKTADDDIVNSFTGYCPKI